HAAGAAAQAAAPLTGGAGLPPIPPLPADPVAAMMNGTLLPGVPGADALFKPFRDLLSSFGTGVMGSLNPADILSQSSQIIQAAMQTGMGAMKSVEGIWQGQAANSAQASNQKNQAHGQEAAQRGLDISKLTDQAAAVVQKGNVQLTEVAHSFAAQAAAMAPVALTPPGQAGLIATATEHLGQAVGIVNVTRGELGGYTGQLGAVVNQLAGQNAPQAADAASQVAQGVGQPIMEQAQNLLSGAGGNSDGSTQAAGLDGLGSGLDGASTQASGFGGNGAHPGSAMGGSGGFGGMGGLGGGSAEGGGASTPKPSGPGVSMPGGKPIVPGMPFGPGMPGGPGAGGAAGNFMGGAPGAAGVGKSEENKQRNVQSYQSPTGNNDLTGPLGESAPEVIGRNDNEEQITEYDPNNHI
ncbi:MAG: hypothetical protein J2P18_13535, partial [Nocardia sp.]|nr:hypothetical protein [Nocardia sp.]